MASRRWRERPPGSPRPKRTPALRTGAAQHGAVRGTSPPSIAAGRPRGPSRAMTDNDHVMEPVRQFVAALNARDLERLREVITDDTEFRRESGAPLRGDDGA